MAMGHSWTTFKRAKRSTAANTWRYCARCGLIGLSNAASALAAKAACPGREDEP